MSDEYKCDGCDELKEGLAPVVLKQEIVRHPDVEPKTIDMMGVRTIKFCNECGTFEDEEDI